MTSPEFIFAFSAIQSFVLSSTSSQAAQTTEPMKPRAPTPVNSEPVEIDKTEVPNSQEAFDKKLGRRGDPMNSEPVEIEKMQVPYSQEAFDKKFEGQVHVSITVDEHGNVSGVRVLDSPGMGLDQVIIEASLPCKFKPAARNGWAARATVVRTIRFSFQ